MPMNTQKPFALIFFFSVPCACSPWLFTLRLSHRPPPAPPCLSDSSSHGSRIPTRRPAPATETLTLAHASRTPSSPSKPTSPPSSSLPQALPPPPSWARIPSPSTASTSLSLPTSEIEERLAGVPVYALANAAQEFVLVSSTRVGGQGGEGVKPPPALGLLCFRKEDADALLEQMEGDMRAGSSVVPVALNKVIQLKSDGVAFRFMPDSSQVANAIKLMQDEGLHAREGFPGVPVFQSRSLVLMSDNKRYRPVFFRKEDLDNSLHRTSRDQQKPNPAVRFGDTQVSSLEDIIKSMKDSSSSKWDDVVFIPPGFDLATSSTPSHLSK